MSATPANAQQTGFADGSWRALNVPHDWSIEGPFAQNFGSGKAATAEWRRLVPKALHAAGQP